jgi:thiol-disulfide isomerase/thioredoxin
MKPSLHRLLLACALLALAPARAADVGSPAPAVALPGRDGAVSLAALKGKVVFLDFWASWCAPCRQSFPWLNEMQARYGGRGLQVLAINVDRQRADAEAFLSQVPARFAIGYDSQGETPRLYAIKGMPSSVLIGADGTVIRQHAGFREDDRAALEAAIVAALGRAPRP